MLTRRSFLAGAAVTAGAQTAPKIKHVDIVHHTHTDVGYTLSPAVIRDLQKRYLDAAIDCCLADARFRWTVESLVELDDWWRAVSAARREQLLALVKAGRMDVMGMPFNQTPCLNALQWRQMMEWIPATLWRSLGIRVAMQNDVNGMPRAGAMKLLDQGVQHLLMGVNTDNGGVPFPRPVPFWWKMPDGRRMFVFLGEHYGYAMRMLQPAQAGNHMKADEAPVRAAHATFTKYLAAMESAGYRHERLIVTFTHPQNYDNGGPFPTLAPFIAEWNRLGLEPRLRLATATEAALDLERAVGAGCPEMQGEWTDWWANGDASAPREVAASRLAKARVAAALSPVFGPMPERGRTAVEEILRDLCLFDEHTWGAAGSVSAPYHPDSLGQFVEKSELAFRPMGLAGALLSRRIRGKVDDMPPGTYFINPAAAAVSGWAGQDWVEKLPANTVRLEEEKPPALASPLVEVVKNNSGWPASAIWPGMKKPLFDGAAGEFICVSVLAPANRNTIHQLHAKPDEAKRREVLSESGPRYDPATVTENPHTVVYSQNLRHDRLGRSMRKLELWRREPRARFTLRLDRLSSEAPEVFYLAFELPAGSALPVVSCGGVPFTPYREQLPGSCRDHIAIDGWADYSTGAGHVLWVTRDAPLVAFGSAHLAEHHLAEPANPQRILAMVFDNTWHTNFVADSHGPMEFQFDMAWSAEMAAPAGVAEALQSNPLAHQNQEVKESPAEIKNIFRAANVPAAEVCPAASATFAR